ncbi:hypothetical protein [Bdellovibrio bacteriovorus]|uniref:Delta-60 repeat protein n=1 Tax=Bdellovibrio bacteriovorus str. Tiberius TaxID=1069642 RepID=K7YK48_BDEBC|nr:hypothetical protein [Bdellovibrio bacteriovorus]AFY00071.1 hypothetical protein Bdt_0363 [Bdellovibrio bacteriovorus str. Tiberius]
MNIRHLWILLLSCLFLSGCTIEAELLRLAADGLPSLSPPEGGNPSKVTASSFNVRTNFPERRGNAQQIHIGSDGQIIFNSVIYNDYYTNSYFKKINNQGAPVALSTGKSQQETPYFSQAHSALNSTGDVMVQLGYIYDPSGEFIGLVKTDINGVVDTSFNSGNPVNINLDQTKYIARWLKVDSSERIYVIGEFTDTGVSEIFISRYLTNGSLDTSYGTAGFAKTDVNSAFSMLEDCTLQSDQKMVCAGAAGNQFFVVRFNTSGVLDTTFSGDGILTDYYQATMFDMDRIHSVITKPGKIFGLGRGTVAGPRIIALNDDGTRDNTFATSGLFSLAPNFSYTDHITLTSSGDLLITGSKVNGANTELRVAKVLANGTSDASFGTSGLVSLSDFKIKNTALNKVATSVTLDGSDRIYLYGISISPDSPRGYYVTKLESNGSLDNSFGTAGVLRPHFLISSNEQVKRSLIQGENLLVAGTMLEGRAVFLSKEHNYALDTNFGIQGHFTFYADNFEYIEYMFLAENPAGGYFLSVDIGNEATQITTQKILKITAAGALDTSFNGTGIISLPNPEAMSMGITAADANGNLYVLNKLWEGANSEKMMISKYNPAGVLATSFGSSGQLVTTLEVWPLDATFRNGRLMVAGNSYDDAYVIRFLPDGSLDLTFNSVGYTMQSINMENEYMSLHFDSDQNVSLFYANYDSEEKFILKMDQDGVPDATWGTGGILAIPTAPANMLTSAVCDSQGRWLLTGTENYRKAFIARLTPAGTLDTTFGNNGYVVDDDYLQFKTIAIVAGDGILTTGEVNNNGVIDVAVIPYDKDGVR